MQYRKLFVVVFVILVVISAIVITLLSNRGGDYINKPVKTSGALKALQFMTEQRAYPNKDIPVKGYFKEYSLYKSRLSKALDDSLDKWKSIGPHNIGGRTLSLAFNYQNPNTIFAGSASGGLWRSYTGGIGVEAWEYISTGFPVLGVSAVAVSPADSNIIYIGTGEVYYYQNSTGGVAVRVTRGSYGIGLLKSTDYGKTWTKSIDWTYEQQRGINVIRINPVNTNEVWAGTSEGTYKSVDTGATWTKVNDVIMATDIRINPDNPEMVWIACGNFGTEGKGVYRTDDGGTTWSYLDNGFPTGYEGKIVLSVHTASPNIIFASVGFGAESNTITRLCRSTNFGDEWEIINDRNYATYQGWYSHLVGVNPLDPTKVICAGVDLYKSDNGGETLTQKTYWYKWYFGTPPAGGPEGPSDYSHADHHVIVYHPNIPEIIYFGTDGGVFRTTDGGNTFEGCNGGYQTTQFYNGFSSSAADSLLALGGMQDNATAIYEGTTAWRRVIGGDGAWTAIDPVDDNYLYGSYQYLGLEKSTNRGQTWNDIQPAGGTTSFVAPYKVSRINRNIIYAGRNRIYRSTTGGNSWTALNNDAVLDGNPALGMDLFAHNDSIIYVTTAPVFSRAGVFNSFDAGNIWNDITGNLPDRYPVDIAIDPFNSEKAYVVFSGFGTPHVFKTEDAGNSWIDITSNLPDVPTSAVAIDTEIENHIYIGNDLGVFFSSNDGESWQSFSAGLPDAVIAMDLSISPSDRSIRVATHGNGVYQRKLVETISDVKDENISIAGFELYQNYPNPFNPTTNFEFRIVEDGFVSLKVYDILGNEVATLVDEEKPAGKYKVEFNIRQGNKQLSSGVYYYTLQTENFITTKKALLLK